MLDAVNGIMLGRIAAIVRKDYEDKRQRQAQGKYQGRPKETDKRRKIAELSRARPSMRKVADYVGCSTSTVQFVKREGVK